MLVSVVITVLILYALIYFFIKSYNSILECLNPKFESEEKVFFQGLPALVCNVLEEDHYEIFVYTTLCTMYVHRSSLRRRKNGVRPRLQVDRDSKKGSDSGEDSAEVVLK